MLRECVTLVSNTGAPQGTVLSPFLFMLYTSNLKYNSESVHLQKFSDDFVIMGCISGGQEGKYGSMVGEFVG